MADAKRLAPTPNGGAVLIDLEEAAYRKRTLPGGAVVIETQQSAGAPTNFVQKQILIGVGT